MAELRFDGRVAIVTGSGRGLGQDYAKLLAARGASVVVCDTGVDHDGTSGSDGPAHDTVCEITNTGGRAAATTTSVATPEGARSVVQEALDTFGRLDILVNNAGIVEPKPFIDLSLDSAREHMNVHFFGQLYMARYAWPHLQASHGNVVNVSSSAIYGMQLLTHYGSAKGAVFALTRSLALEGAPDRIRVNCLLPIGVTRMWEASGAAIPDAEVRRLVESEVASKKVAPMVGFLAHADCPVTGKAFSAGRDRAALVFIGETVGFRKPDLSIEDIAENFPTICDQSTVLDFADNDEMMSHVMSLPYVSTDAVNDG